VGRSPNIIIFLTDDPAKCELDGVSLLVDPSEGRT
tara:strand:- start:700 stop:804 length:105 start_codon:yes stop_codon:yes gene_type:complete